MIHRDMTSKITLPLGNSALHPAPNTKPLAADVAQRNEFFVHRDEFPEPGMVAASAPVAPALQRQEGGGHYKAMKIQPIEFIHANGLGFAEGSVVKYISRWRVKGGVEDLRKARHFIDLLLDLEAPKT